MEDIFDSKLTKAEPICVGVLWCGDDERAARIMQHPNGDFVNPETELHDWAYALNNPWSDTSTHYTVHPNYHFPGEWIAERTIIVYDDIEAHIAARADSPSEAIKAVDKFLQEVIDKYYIKDQEDETD